MGQGMGNGIFWSEIVKGLQGECTHPPPDVFFESIPLKSSGSVTRYHVLLPVPLKPLITSFRSVLKLD